MSQRLTAAVILKKREKTANGCSYCFEKSDAIYDDVAKEISKIPHRIFD